MSWRVDSTAGAHIWDSQPMSDDDLALRDEELTWLKRHEHKNWRLINGRIANSDALTALEGTYGGMLAYPPAQNLTAVTGVTANTALWSAALYSPLPANSVLAPDAYRIIASGTVTTATAAPTMTPAATVGAAAGTGLGSGAVLTLGSTITAALWYLIGDVTLRTAGSAGTAIAQFVLKVGTTAGGATAVSQDLFGGVAQTAIDFTAAQGITISSAFSITSVSVTPMQVHFMSFN